METFKYIDKFNEALQDEIRTLELNVEAKSYEDLKKDPKKYSFYEMKDYITFILKNIDKNNGTFEALERFIVFRVYAEIEEVTLKSFSIYESEVEFMKKAVAGAN